MCRSGTLACIIHEDAEDEVTAFWIAAQTIAHQAVETVEILPHVSRAGSHINPRCRSKAKHCRYPLSNTVNSRSRVTASNPRRTSIRRPPRNSTSNNAPPTSASRFDASGMREHS